MTTETIHTCSYECERPGCIRAQRDELVAKVEALRKVVEEMQRRLDREESDHGRTIDQRDAAEDALGRMFQAVTGRTAEWSSAWGYVDAIEEVEEHIATLAQQLAAGDGCHCGTCTCNPNMTPAVRFDLSPAQQEGAIREHLIRLGWTPPGEHALSQQPAAPSGEVVAGVEPLLESLIQAAFDDGDNEREEFSERVKAARASVVAYVQRLGATPQQHAAVDEAAAIRAFEEHFEASAEDPYFEGELKLWLTAWRKALAAQQQGGAE